MDTELIFEIRVFFLCGLCGIACAVVYDLLRIIRRVFNTGSKMTFFMDIIFWIMCTILTFGMVFYANYGQIRWYEGVGLVLGASVYFLSASKMVTDGGVLFLKFVISLLKNILKVVIFPFAVIFKGLSKFFRKYYIKIRKKNSKK
ncbi:MAG: spore cortex biosynthesis protein YabQ [Clostridia bacterium]|nr:spore cortex biosynthesis protein YabQ [Clostridia bacterium]